MSSLFLESRISPTYSAQPARARRASGQPPVEHVDSPRRQIFRRNVALANLQLSTNAAVAASTDSANRAVGESSREGGIEMGSSVEGLKLRRMRVRNELSFSRSTEGGAERSEDLEALREELRRLSKQ